MKFFSFEKSSKKEQPNPLKSEHLKEGVSPIMTCIGTPEQFKEEPGAEQEIFQDLSLDKNSNRNVNYYEDPDKLSKQNFKNAGSRSYVISSIDNSNKLSKGFKNCTGLVTTGLDKKTGQNISFLSHEDPTKILEGKEVNKEFINDLREQLAELKERCIDGTIDAVIVGGNYFNDTTQFQYDYLSSVKLLSEEVQNTLGFEPVIMTGPKTEHGNHDDVFYDNDHRRLYIIRPEVGKESTKSYVQSDIENQKKRW